LARSDIHRSESDGGDSSDGSQQRRTWVVLVVAMMATVAMLVAVFRRAKNRLQTDAGMRSVFTARDPSPPPQAATMAGRGPLAATVNRKKAISYLKNKGKCVRCK